MRPIGPDGGPVREHETGLRVRPEATHPVHAGQHGNRADIQLNIYLVVSACSEQDAVLVCRAMPERWACCPLTPPVSLHVPVSSAYHFRRANSPAGTPARAAARLLYRAHIRLGSVGIRIRARCWPLCSEDVDLGRRELTVRVPYVPHEFSVRPSGRLRFGHAGLPPSWTRGYRLLWGCLPGFASHDFAQRVAPSHETIAMKMRIKGRAI